MWYGSCYTPYSKDPFPAHLTFDNDDDVLIKPGDENHFNVKHEGVHFFTLLNAVYVGTAISRKVTLFKIILKTSCYSLKLEELICWKCRYLNFP